MRKKDTKLFETIRIENGIACNLKYHNQRLNRSRKELFGIDDPVDIAAHLTGLPAKDLYRAKLIYGKKIEKPIYTIYKPKNIEKLYLMEAALEYPYKYLDRSEIDLLVAKASMQNRQRAETRVCPYDIVIVKDGLLADTSIANIALRQNGLWYTPAKPLLPGTTRARLLDAGKLQLRDITAKEISHYDGIALMNAMIGFHRIKYPLQTLLDNLDL